MNKVTIGLVSAYLFFTFSSLGFAAQDIPNTKQDTKTENIEVKWEILWNKKTGSLPKGVELTIDGKEAWVTNFGHDKGHNISVYDAKTGDFKRYISFKGRRCGNSICS